MGYYWDMNDIILYTVWQSWQTGKSPIVSWRFIAFYMPSINRMFWKPTVTVFDYQRAGYLWWWSCDGLIGYPMWDDSEWMCCSWYLPLNMFYTQPRNHGACSGWGWSRFFGTIHMWMFKIRARGMALGTLDLYGSYTGRLGGICVGYIYSYIDGVVNQLMTGGPSRRQLCH